MSKKIFLLSSLLYLDFSYSFADSAEALKQCVERPTTKTNQDLQLSRNTMEAQSTEKTDLQQTVLKGRLEFYRSCSLSPLSGAYFNDSLKDDKSVYFSSGVNCAVCNGIIETCDDRIPSDKEIDLAIDFFESRKLPFMWWSSAKKLEDKRFQFGGILKGLALDVSQDIPEKPSSSHNLEVKIIQSDAEITTFCKHIVDAFGLDPVTLDQFKMVNTAAMKQGEQIHFIAYLNSIPVGTASLSTCQSSAGVWNLSAVPEHRKHGIGGALVHAALVEAKKRQYKQVMAILMPKGMAWGLFNKLGFKEVCQFPFYIYGASPDDLEK